MSKRTVILNRTITCPISMPFRNTDRQRELRAIRPIRSEKIDRKKYTIEVCKVINFPKKEYLK